MDRNTNSGLLSGRKAIDCTGSRKKKKSTFNSKNNNHSEEKFGGRNNRCQRSSTTNGGGEISISQSVSKSTKFISESNTRSKNEYCKPGNNSNDKRNEHVDKSPDRKEPGNSKDDENVTTINQQSDSHCERSDEFSIRPYDKEDVSQSYIETNDVKKDIRGKNEGTNGHQRFSRIGTYENERRKIFSTEYQLNRKIFKTNLSFHRNIWNKFEWGKHSTGIRRGARCHYSIWKNSYDFYLWEIFDRVAGKLNTFKSFSDIELNFEDFIEFAYEFSSGYITPYN